MRASGPGDTRARSSRRPSQSPASAPSSVSGTATQASKPSRKTGIASTISVQRPTGARSAVAIRVRASASTSRPSPNAIATRTIGVSSQAARLSPSGPIAAMVTAWLVAPAQAEDRQEERREEDLDPDDEQRHREHREALLGELAEAAVDPDAHDHDRQHEPREHHRAAEEEPVLEPEARPHAVEPRIAVAHEVGAVGVRAEPERQHLRADDQQQRPRDHRVAVPGPSEE